MNISQEKMKTMLNDQCENSFGCTLEQATVRQAYEALCIVIRDMLAKKRSEFQKAYTANEQKQVYYLSLEFLVGTSLRNNLYNLGLEKQVEGALAQTGIDLETLYAMEPDAGLGNGGLGRLASCYMDALTSLDFPATGYSIRYEFGIFKQKIIDGWQMEFPDDWLDLGGVWLVPRRHDAVEVKFGGNVLETFDENGYKAIHENYDTVLAVPYDLYLSGYDSKAVNKLVLWSAKSPTHMDMLAFSRGEYAKALEQNTMAEVISKVLYPADEHIEGKRLRLKQQYLLVSASLQSILNCHLEQHQTLTNLPEKVAIHINDTHPALCVPELMRILMDEHGMGWDEAWHITCRTLTYTNHTVMSEALERWSESLFQSLMPRLYQIVAEINRRLVDRLVSFYGDDHRKIEYMAVIANGEIRMANLCLAACHKVNGVSKLHSEILINSIFHDYYYIEPDKFTNVTNGIAYRRWLCQSNPALTELLVELIGDRFVKDATALEDLMKYYDDASVLERLQQIKLHNKTNLANYIEMANGIHVDPHSVFDIQIKRLHEYKRQLLNVLQILAMYRRLKQNPGMDFVPRTFIFAAKASSGYFMAKQIIRLIVTVSKLVNNDPQLRNLLKVVFIEDYKVSLAELIIPAADISEQISIAGKEASGTGNMKLMINGAVTIGTMDGANVEIFEQVGSENMFLFGLTVEEVEQLWAQGYDPTVYLTNNPELHAVIDMLTSGELGARFEDIVSSLVTNHRGAADAYMTLADFESYQKAQQLVSDTYLDRRKFTNMSLVNIAKAGVFSADRAVAEYAERIWKL